MMGTQIPIADGEVEELNLEEQPESSLPPKRKSKTSGPAVVPLGEPSLNESDYFQDYDRLVLDRTEVIMVAISGKKAAFATLDELRTVLRPYSEYMHSQGSEVPAPMWLDLQYPTHEAMLVLVESFGIHSLTVEDCLVDTEKAQQKIELFDHYRFVSFAEHHVIPYTNIWNSVDVQLIMPLTCPIMIAVHNGPVSYLCGLLNRVQALTPSSAPDMRSKKVQKLVPGRCVFASAEWLMYGVLDQIVDQFLGLVYECAVEVSRLDELIFVLPGREQADFLRRIGAVRSRISVLRLQLIRKQEIVKELLMTATDPREASLSYNRGIVAVKVFLRDILDHVVAMLIDLEQDKETLQSITSAFLSKVSIEVSLKDKEQNDIMKKFSAMATIILPLTFVTALFGMNVPVPWAGTAGVVAFGSIVGVLVAVGLIASLIFWCIDWF